MSRSVKPSLPLLLALLFVLLALSPASAPAQSRWPGTTVTYRDATPWPGSVAQAVKWWNDAPGPLRLVRSAGRRAHIRIVPGNLPSNIAGRASYPPGGHVVLDAPYFGSISFRERANVIAHEIGHALGLPHLRSRCTLMYGGPGGPDNPGCGTSTGDRCGPQRPDVRMLLRRYGGRLGAFRGFRCGTQPSPPPVDGGPLPPLDEDPSEDPVESDPGAPPESGHRVAVAIRRTDDFTVVKVNGRDVGFVGKGESMTFDLGPLAPTDRVTVMTFNERDGYAWDYVIRVGNAVWNLSGAGNQGRNARYVYGVSFDADGGDIDEDNGY